MSTNTSSFINQFTVNQVPITVNSDIRFNIIKRRETVLYKEVSDNDNINLAYVINDELNAQKNIFISDRSAELAANKIPENINPIIFHSKSITLSVDRFKATNIFVTSIVQQKVPLFNKHVIKNFDPNNDVINDISLRDKNFKVINVPNILIDKTIGTIYNNLDNTDSNFYYVHYSIQDNLSNSITSYTEILDNEPIYTQAQISDLDNTGQLIHDRKVYLIDSFSSNVFEVSFPTTDYYAIIEEPNSRIKLLPAPSTDNQNPWFISVSNGSFFASILNHIFKYNIPEFNTQLFNPEAPFKFKQNEVGLQIDNKLFRTLKGNIDSSKFVDVILRNPDQSARLAFTTNPSKLNTLLENFIVYQNGIRSIDRKNGIIDLSVNILDTDIIETSYYYSESEYEIIDIDFNPINNNSILGKRIVFYTVPNTTDARTKTLFYLIVNNKGIIEVANQTDNTSLTTDVLTNTFLYDSGTPNFIDKYTVQFKNNINPSNPNYLVLGEVFVNITKHPIDATIFDVRKEGGGIKDQPGLLNQLAKIDPEVIYVTNITGWDGLPYPGNGSLLIELPVTVQKQNGGLFTDVELREIVERHMGFGIYGIIHGYGTDVHPIVEVVV